ncbi:hypothetical protein [Paractinoplanes maris]|uniref:hypothetical protein n=1 Tax=Paractinoplanes maris TaxID=1734446 RepID=UPI002021EEA6|nr:hypothetical protein [Actinoplanes maris]
MRHILNQTHPTSPATAALLTVASPVSRPRPERRTGRTGRIVGALVVVGMLSSAGACGTAQPPPGTAQAPSAARGPSAAAASTPPAAIRNTCEALGRAYQTNMAPLAESLTKFVADRKTIAAAQQSLAAFATAVQEATATSDDADLKAAGKKAATQMHSKSTDDKFFGAIKTSKDIDKTLGPTLTGWLSPVTRHCS